MLIIAIRVFQGVKDDGANAATDTSKGSSPDMEEYEVITDGNSSPTVSKH